MCQCHHVSVSCVMCQCHVSVSCVSVMCQCCVSMIDWHHHSPHTTTHTWTHTTIRVATTKKIQQLTMQQKSNTVTIQYVHHMYMWQCSTMHVHLTTQHTQHIDVYIYIYIYMYMYRNYISLHCIYVDSHSVCITCATCQSLNVHWMRDKRNANVVIKILCMSPTPASRVHPCALYLGTTWCEESDWVMGIPSVQTLDALHR